MPVLKTLTPETRSDSEKSNGRDDNNDIVGDVATLEAQGTAKFSRLGWKRLTVVLIVEAIALGALSIPSAFAALGMVAGVITTVGMGFIAIYTSYVVGQVKIKFPEVAHYADAGRLMMGRFGYELIGAMFALELIFLVGSHCLTGTIAFVNLTDSGTCSLGMYRSRLESHIVSKSGRAQEPNSSQEPSFRVSSSSAPRYPFKAYTNRL